MSDIAEPGDRPDGLQPASTVERWQAFNDFCEQLPEPPPVAPDPQPLPTVPGFEIHERLGRGGCGEVYRARQLALDRVVALKFLCPGPDVNPDDMATRFEREARAMAAVNHPHVVPVYDFVTSGEQRVIVLEYMPGGTLDQWCAARTLTPEDVARLVLKVARGVAAVLERGFWHRDLKPGNILFDALGEPRVADYGLAGFGTSDITRPNFPFGTLPYMSPEQAQGQIARIGPPTDVWSLGVILYERLTGRRPFVGTMYEILTQVIATDPKPVLEVAPSVPSTLATIVEKCLRRDPVARYASAKELADALAAFLNPVPQPVLESPPAPAPAVVPPVLEAPPAPAPIAVPPVGRAWFRRWPILVAVGTAAALVVALVVALSRPPASAARDDRPAPGPDTVQPLPPLPAAPPPSPAALEAVQLLAAAQTVWPDNPSAVRELEKIPQHLRGWEWDYVRNLARPIVRRVPGPSAGSIYAAALDPDGKRAATGHKNGTVRVWDLASGDVKVFGEPDDAWSVYAVAWNAGGTVVAAGTKFGRVRLWDAVSGKEESPIEAHGEFVRGIAFSPIDGWAATAGGDKTARVWNVATGTERADHPSKGHGNAVVGVACSRDGKWLATASWDGTARIWNMETKQLQRELKHGDRVVSVAFDRDGTRVVTACWDKTSVLWDAKTGAELLRFKGHDAFVMTAAFSPDGEQVVTASRDATARVWDAVSGAELFAIRGHAEPVNAAAFTPDGRVLTASSDESIGLWPDPRGRFLSLRGLPNPTAVGFVGDAIAVIDGNGKSRSWDATTGKANTTAAAPPEPPVRSGERMLSIEPDGVVRVARGGATHFALKVQANAAVFSPDGTRIATAGADGTVRVWDAVSGVEMLVLKASKSPVRAVAWSPDGARLGTASEDGVVRVWNSKPAPR